LTFFIKLPYIPYLVCSFSFLPHPIQTANPRGKANGRTHSAQGDRKSIPFERACVAEKAISRRQAVLQNRAPAPEAPFRARSAGSAAFLRSRRNARGFLTRSRARRRRHQVWCRLFLCVLRSQRAESFFRKTRKRSRQQDCAGNSI
jgi:hypothetical protein